MPPHMCYNAVMENFETNIIGFMTGNEMLTAGDKIGVAVSGGADSMALLRQTVELVRRDRWEVVWVDAVIEAQVPRLNDCLPAVRVKVNAVLNPESDGQDGLRFNVKAKSPEKTGDPGAARAMVCRAVATLRRRSA